MQKRLRFAVRIVTREVIFGEDGTQVGEKFVSMFPQNRVSLLWTENDEMFEVEAALLRDLFEYRKDFRR